MKIRHISIKKYKNLKDFDCEFSDSNISAFIGNNGSGKSNLLEAITTIFSFAKSVIEKNNPRLVVTPDVEDYVIEYENEGLDYTLEGSRSDFNIYQKGKLLRSQLSKELALPETIMLYYAGETTRQYDTAKRSFDEAYDNKLKKADNKGFSGFKYLDYYSTSDLNLLLITAAVFQGEYYEKLLNLINCSGISLKTTFSLKNPSKNRSEKSADSYWGARGFVKSFLDETRRFVTATADLSDLYIMSFRDISPIKELCLNEADMFAKLKALKNAGYLDALPVMLRGIDGEEFSYDELSEGEKQLSLLLLLTTFTANLNCFYLFDEFDAYLHPGWQRIFSELLSDIEINGQVILTTHSPLTLGKMKKESIRILKNGEVYTPSVDTYNRDITEVLEEIMDVGKRPAEVEIVIRKFRNAAVHGKKDDVQESLKDLEKLLSPEDPFWVTAEHMLARLRMV